MNELRGVHDKLVQIYERCSEQARISPAWLATEICQELDGRHGMQRLTPQLYAMAHAHARQMARALCRRRFEGEGEFEQEEMFEGLQERYPAARQRGDDPEYVLLDCMDGADVAFNIQRLTREAGAKLKHADALKAYWNRRQQENGGKVQML